MIRGPTSVLIVLVAMLLILSGCTREEATASLGADVQADEFEIIHARQLTQFANDAAGVINNKINLPADRIQSGVVHGVLISALHDLLSMEAEYSRPSP